MSHGRDAESILRLLLESEKACLKTIEIVNSGKWSSGSQIKRAVNELENERLIEFFETDEVVRMTNDGILKFRHPNYRSLTPLSDRLKRKLGPYVKPFAYAISALIAFVWVMLSQVLAPEEYCEMLPSFVTEWLAPCTNLQTESKL